MSEPLNIPGVADALRSSVTNPDTIRALNGFFAAPSANKLVPLVEMGTLTRIRRQPMELVGVIAVTGSRSGDALAINIDTLPPEDRDKKQHLELAVDLVEPFQADEFDVGTQFSDLLSCASANSGIITGVVEFGQTDVERGFAYSALLIPEYYLHEGYDIVRNLNPTHPDFTEESRIVAATSISAGVFDYISRRALELGNL